MASFLTNDLELYLPPHSMPLYVEAVATGAHPERRFHGHTFMEIVLILAGEGVHLIGEKSVGIRAGDVLLIHPGISHGYDRTATLGLVNLVYDPLKLSLPLLDGQQMPLFDRLFNPRRVVAEELLSRPLVHLDAGETAEQDFPIWFKAQETRTISGFIVVDSTGAQSAPIDVPVVVLQNDQPPVLTLPDAETKVFPQNYALENYTAEEKKTLFTEIRQFLKDNGAEVESVDPVVSLENAAIEIVSEPDRTKLGVQRLRVTATDSAGNVSAPVSVRVEYTVSDDFDFATLPEKMNLLQDPGFEEAAAGFTGSGGDDFAQYRLSSAWTLEPTAIYLKRGTTAEGDGAGEISDASWTKAATDNSADTAQGPILLNTEQSWFSGKTVRDNGYSDVSKKNNMDTLPKDDMKHRLVYKAPSSEKAKNGKYSLALRGKSYQPVQGSSLFLGTGVKLTQPVALSAGKSYVISSAIIRSFGRNESGNLDGMVGGIYVMLKEGDTVLSEIQIVGHGKAAQYGQFVTYVGDPYAADADKDAVFEFRRYLSNDDGTKEDINSTWGYSPIYIDDCAVYEIDAHIPEAEQIAAEALESEAQTLIGEGGGQ